MALGRFDNNKIKTLIANTLVYLSPALFFLSLFDRFSLGSQTVYLTELCEHNLKSLLYFAFSLAVMVCVGIDPARFKKAVLFSKSGWNLLLLLITNALLAFLCFADIEEMSTAFVRQDEVVVPMALFAIVLADIRYCKSDGNLICLLWFLFPTALILGSEAAFYKDVLLGSLCLFFIRDIFEKRRYKKLKLLISAVVAIPLFCLFSFETGNVWSVPNVFDSIVHGNGSGLFVPFLYHTFGLVGVLLYVTAVVFMILSVKKLPYFAKKSYLTAAVVLTAFLLVFSTEDAFTIFPIFLPFFTIMAFNLQFRENRYDVLKNGFRLFGIFKVDNVSGEGSLSNALKLLHDLGKIREVIAKLPMFLKDGVYYIDVRNKKVTGMKTGFSKKVVVRAEAGGFGFSEIRYDHGASKLVFFKDDKCYCCYTAQEFKGALKRMERIGELNYPFSKPLECLEEKNILVCETVRGEQYYDEVHESILVREAVRLAQTEPVTDKNGVLLQFQHCDFGLNNVVWENDESYKCIDCDCIDDAPVFLDLLALLLKKCINIEYLEDKIKQYPEIEKAAGRIFPNSDNVLDDIMDNCVRGLFENSRFNALFYFIAYLDLSDYPKTKRSLKKIG